MKFLKIAVPWAVQFQVEQMTWSQNQLLNDVGNYSLYVIMKQKMIFMNFFLAPSLILREVLNRLSMTGVRRSGSPGLAHFFLTSTRWLPMYENQNPVTNSREKCYQIYLWPFQTSKMNFLPNDPFFYRSVPKVAYWWVEQHITRSVSVPQPLQSYRMMMGYQCMN